MWCYATSVLVVLQFCVMQTARLVDAQDCTNVVTAVASPIIYPTTSPYLANAFCIWRVELAANTRVKTVIDPVDIEASTTPYNDFLLVFDGPTCTSPILSRIAGSTAQTVVASSNNTSFMFISNGATEMTGFTATASEAAVGDTTSVASSAPCGGTLTDDVGTLDGSTIGDTNICIWHINTTSARMVNLMILDVANVLADQWYQVFSGNSCATSPVTKKNGPTIAAYNYQANTSELVVISYGIPLQATYTARASLESMAWVQYSMILTAAAAWWKI